MKSVIYPCIALLLAVSLQAQTVTRGSWAAVQSIKPGRQVQVHRLGTDRVDGEFQSATDDGITVQSKAGVTTCNRVDVRQVKVKNVSSRFRNGAIGAAIGAGGAAGIVLVASGGNVGDELGQVILAVFTIAGTVAGFGLGMAPPAYATVYKAGQP